MISLGAGAAAAAAAGSAAARSGPSTLMLFKGCPRPLGATILLKSSGGEPAGELAAVKRVAAFAAYAAYWNRLEAELLADQLASAAAAAAAIPQPPPQQQPEQQQHGAGGEAAAGAGGSAAFWEALAAACAEASARGAAEARESGAQPIVFPSPHITFVGPVAPEEPAESGAGPASGSQAGEAEGSARWAAGAPATTTASSVASSPTKSVAAAARTLDAAASTLGTAAGAAAGAAPPQPAPTSPSTGTAAEREEAVLRGLMLAESSSASDPWVVPADADGATVTVAGHTFALSEEASATWLTKSASQASLPGGGGGGDAAAAADLAQLDPLSRAALEAEQQLAGSDGESDSSSEEGGEAGPGLAEEPSAADLVGAAPGVAGGAAAGPALAPITTTRPGSIGSFGVRTAQSSPRLPDGQPGSVAGGAEGPSGSGGGLAAAAAVYAQQQLWVSISCKNPAKGILCEPPHTHCMPLYAKEGERGWGGARTLGCPYAGVAPLPLTASAAVPADHMWVYPLGTCCPSNVFRSSPMLPVLPLRARHPNPPPPEQTCPWRTSWRPPRPRTASARTPAAARARCCTCAASCTGTGWSHSPACACRRGRSCQVRGRGTGRTSGRAG